MSSRGLFRRNSPSPSGDTGYALGIGFVWPERGSGVTRWRAFSSFSSSLSFSSFYLNWRQLCGQKLAHHPVIEENLRSEGPLAARHRPSQEPHHSSADSPHVPVSHAVPFPEHPAGAGSRESHRGPSKASWAADAKW